MNLKTLIIGCILAMLPMSMTAQENVLQILPNGLVKSGTGYALSIEMNNSEAFAALQFTVVLPEGISVANSARPYSSLPASRFPYTEIVDEWEGTSSKVYDHSVSFGKKDNTATIVISPNTLSEIKGNSGAILRLYVELDADIKDGLYPIIFKDIVFSTVDAKAVRLAEAASYVVVGSPALQGMVDLSSLTGYLPKDVANATTNLLADAMEVTELNLTGVDEAGAAVSVANPNALVYTKTGSAFAAMQIAAGGNVVTGNVCDKLTLVDGYPFAATQDFTATSATYSRTVPTAGWYSLCLPFSATASTGVEVERFVAIDVNASTVTFEKGDVEAYKPCIFKTDATEVAFSVENVAVSATPASLADGLMTGTLSAIPEGGLTGLYALRGDGSGFGKCTETASAAPFRAFINDVAEAKFMSLWHDGETTGICAPVVGLQITPSVGQCKVKSVGEAKDLIILMPDGRVVEQTRLEADEARMFVLPAGIYLFNNQKIIVR